MYQPDSSTNVHLRSQESHHYRIDTEEWLSEGLLDSSITHEELNSEVITLQGQPIDRGDDGSSCSVGDSGSTSRQNLPSRNTLASGNVDIQTEADVTRAQSSGSGALQAAAGIGDRLTDSTDRGLRARSGLLSFVSTLARLPGAALQGGEHSREGPSQGGGNGFRPLPPGMTKAAVPPAEGAASGQRVALQVSVGQNTELLVTVAFKLVADAAEEPVTAAEGAAPVAVSDEGQPREELSAGTVSETAACAVKGAIPIREGEFIPRSVPSTELRADIFAGGTSEAEDPPGVVASAASRITSLVGGFFGRRMGVALVTPQTSGPPAPQLPAPLPAPEPVLAPTTGSSLDTSGEQESERGHPPQPIPSSDATPSDTAPPGDARLMVPIEGRGEGAVPSMVTGSGPLTSEERRKLRVASQMAAQLRQV